MQETLNHLAGSWKIYQLKHGHRFSADDLLVAWRAARARPAAARLLDLGSGIGSVGLLTLYKLPSSATLLGVERQSVSLELAQRTVALNGLEQRVQYRLGDLRDDAPFADLEPFPLITGSPPYFPLGTATVSPQSQRAAARCELHGDVFDYCARAARLLAPGGLFAFVHVASDPRPAQAIQRAGLTLVQRTEVFFRAHLEPTVALFECAWEGPRQPDRCFTIRDAEGRWTQDYLDMREEMGTSGLRR